MFLGGEWLTTCGPAAEQPNLVANPSFEQVTDTGRPAGWSGDPAVYTVVADRPRSGTRCLRFENSEPGRYLLCSRGLDLQPGQMYELEAWVRTEQLQGEESGATLCIEWRGADGQWLGGAYPAGVKGTQGAWTRVAGLTPRIPAEAQGFTVSCYVRKGMTGVAWWDDLAVRRYLPPPLTAVVTDAYRNTVAGGPLTVRVGLALDTYQLPLDAWSVTLEVTGPDGQVAVRRDAADRTLHQAAFMLDTDAWTPGEYTANCTVTSRDGAHHISRTCRVKRVKAMPQRRASIDRHGRLLLDGKPFFPLGTYWGGVEQQELDLYAKSPFNCLMPYRALKRETLDAVEQAGLKVIYSVKDYYHGMRWTPSFIRSQEDERRIIERTVTELRDHPAIMAWYINDELPLTMREQLTAHRDWLEELDPERPTWVVLYQVDQVRAYLPTFDVIGTDPYPIPERSISEPLQWTRKTVESVFASRAVWMVPQIFNWAGYKKTDSERARYRAPTLAEMRCMAWQCIAGGANGLVFYSWFDLWKMQPADPFTQRWADVTAMAAEIKQWTPVLLAVDPVPRATPVAVPDTVGVRLYARDGHVYVVTVNGSRAPVTARWTFDRSFHGATVELGESAARWEDTTLELQYAPLEVKIVRLTP